MAPSSSRIRARVDTINALIANGFPYSKKLSAHTSCVNALGFSAGGGRFLASGGDDLTIKIWDFHQEDVTSPVSSLIGPKRNVFALDFSATNQYLLSAGADDVVLKHDLGHLGQPTPAPGSLRPTDQFHDHNDSVLAVSCHPRHDGVFLSASESGSIALHDLRESRRTRAQNLLQLTSEVTDAKWNPLMEHIFASSESSGRVCLRDIRMAFGPLTQRSKQGVVQQYTTLLSKTACDRLSNPEASSLAFDKDGSRLAVTMLHYLPTIYSVSDPHPIATCSGANLPNGTPAPPSERTYSNSCTMKHGTFGGPALDQDVLYAAGSDDFRGYVWRVPRTVELLERRREVDIMKWNTSDVDPNVIGFTTGTWEPRHIPVELSTPLCHLTGHVSIVNSVVFHPDFLHIVTSGIERDIRLHSATPSSPCAQGLAPTPTDVRRLGDDDETDREVYWRALTGGFPSAGDDVDEQTATISSFDHILREEGNTDVFELRRYRADDDSSSSSSSRASSSDEGDYSF